MIRRFGTPPKADRQYIRRLGAYAILPRDGQLLLTLQSDPDPDLQLPGGGVDPGESPMRALHREVVEETGWRISTARHIGTYRRFTYMPEYDLWAEKLCLIFHARPVYALGEPTETGHQAVWMTPDQAAVHLNSPGDRHFARSILRHTRRHAPLY